MSHPPLITRYPSVAALADDAERRACLDRFGWDAQSIGGETTADTLRLARAGDTSAVPAAEALIDRLMVACAPSRASWQPDICGAYPIVPEFIAGVPECMRRRVALPDERAPINIHVAVSVSSGVTAAQIAQRGAAILALVLLLSRERPVTLNILEIGQRHDTRADAVLSVAVNTTPLDVATAAYALTSAAFFRRLILGVHCAIESGATSFPEGYSRDPAGCMRRICCELGGDPERDLMIAGAVAGEPLLNDPVGWVQAQLDRYGLGESE